ncbi:MAG TPA: aldo/keto reductase [Candidatus Baltobacteraceae bacterium]|nr:aldo/keto reductase [Candidatus Baltobacteraceae bacterium]
MNSRILGSSGIRVSEIGYGCMGLSWAYGQAMHAPDERAAAEVLQTACDLGITFFDTADMYGPFTNEEIVGKALRDRRDNVVIATKCGLVVSGDRTSYDLQRDARPEHIRQACDASLKRLQIEVIDVYQLHRVDPNVPIEESVGAMAELVQDGKVRAIGLSEVDVPALERAMRVHPIATLQSEYSLFERNIEARILPWCTQHDVTLLPYSPLGRGMLTGRLSRTDIGSADFRSTLPRYQADAFEHNRRIVERIERIAARTGATAGQVALAWLLAKAPSIVPIPGTTRIEHLRENVAAAAIRLTQADLTELDSLPAPMGDRYPAAKAPAR